MVIKAMGKDLELPPIGSLEQYHELMKVLRNRITVRKFQQDYKIPEEHFNLIIDAARHAPSGANVQPWQFIIVEKQETKDAITEYFVSEQRFRAREKMKFPTPDYRGLATAPGFIVVCSDMRWVQAFPVFRGGYDKDENLAEMYRENAERILLQSVAAATMSAHLAAASLGYCVWWVTAIGQANAQAAMRPLLGIPKEISVLDIFLFGPPAQKPYKRWKKSRDEIVSWGSYDTGRLFMSDEDIQHWIKAKRHKVMYRDKKNID